MSDNLDPLEPEAAMDLYLDTRRGELRPKTFRSQRYRLTAFVRWCRAEGITNMNDVDGRTLHAFRVARRDGFEDYDQHYMDDYAEVGQQTLYNHLSTLRVFLRFVSKVDAVPESLPSKIILPTVSEDEQVSDTTLDPARADSILHYLDRYHYASRKHVILLLLWHTGCRAGGIRALDLEDVDLDGTHPRVDGPAVNFVHRPETDTPLKNGERGERWNGISEYVAEVLHDYINGPRNDIEDSYGRDPLLTTRQGRPRVSTIRNTMYAITRPCWYGEECPHDREIDSCEAAPYKMATKCPSSRSPHDARSGSLTRYLLQDTPRDVVQDRMNVSDKVLDRHYDRRTLREKMEQRRKYLPDQ
ncbi:tyrosine-type recombinase/integrase [Halorientalis brevis]|uniref:Tyrosine-type recombinase/integrase n=1 Tax=Halorientalis brevis TaxID=1126241 RepID=A0ABD6C6V9_9EURY|nr:site-specific integrase [Halorientalis brevis]